MCDNNNSTPQGRLVLGTTTAFFFFFFFSFTHFYFPASGQAVVTGVVPFPPRFLPSIFIAHRVQQSYCSSIFHRVLLTHALALSASQFVHKKKSQRVHTSMHSAGLELTKLTYTRLEDNLVRHRGDRLCMFGPESRMVPTGVSISHTRCLKSSIKARRNVSKVSSKPDRRFYQNEH